MEKTIIIGNDLSYFDISQKDIQNGFKSFQRGKLRNMKTKTAFKLKFNLQQA